MINNILDLATIDAGAMALNLTQVDIRACMDEAAEGVQDRLKTDGIALDIRAAPGIGTFNADGRRLRQVLFDLLSNAVGFSPPGETVTLAAERRPDAVVFSVTDRGPGIPPEAMDKVFDWFETELDGLAAPRQRTWPVAGALLRRAAWRHRDHRLDARQRHDGNLPFPDRAGSQADRGIKKPPGARPGGS